MFQNNPQTLGVYFLLCVSSVELSTDLQPRCLSQESSVLIISGDYSYRRSRQTHDHPWSDSVTWLIHVIVSDITIYPVLSQTYIPNFQIKPSSFQNVMNKLRISNRRACFISGIEWCLMHQPFLDSLCICIFRIVYVDSHSSCNPFHYLVRTK